MRAACLIAFSLGAVAGACRGDFDSTCATGTRGCSCLEMGGCDAGLTCVDSICVDLSEDDGAEDASDATDAGDETGDETSGEATDGTSDETTDTSTDDGESDDTSGDTGGSNAFADDFEDGNYDGWEVLNPEVANIAVEEGALQIEPDGDTLWFQDGSSVLVHQSAEGNFRMTAAVAVTTATIDGTPPPPPNRAGGIMLRNPDDAEGQNLVMAVFGADSSELSAEWSSTETNGTAFGAMSWPSAAGELRLCRVDSFVGVYAREGSEGAWTTLNDLARGDLPNVLQVGMVAHNNPDNANVRASFDFFEVEPVSAEADCTAP